MTTAWSHTTASIGSTVSEYLTNSDPGDENSLTVYAVILDPQGSMGGFDWFDTDTKAQQHADRVGRDLVLGIVPIRVDKNLSSDEITNLIDSNLTDIEHGLGYGETGNLVCPECGEEIWDMPSGSKLAKCWNAEGHEHGGTLAFDTIADDDEQLYTDDEVCL
jgi:hypothetical protein